MSSHSVRPRSLATLLALTVVSACAANPHTSEDLADCTHPVIIVQNRTTEPILVTRIDNSSPNLIDHTVRVIAQVSPGREEIPVDLGKDIHYSYTALDGKQVRRTARPDRPVSITEGCAH